MTASSPYGVKSLPPHGTANNDQQNQATSGAISAYGTNFAPSSRSIEHSHRSLAPSDLTSARPPLVRTPRGARAFFSTAHSRQTSPIASTRALSYGLSNPGSDGLTAIAFGASAEGSFPSSLHPKFDNPPEPIIDGRPFSHWDTGTKLSVFQEYWRENHPERISSVGRGSDGLDERATTGGEFSHPSVDCDAPANWLGKLYQPQPPVSPETSEQCSVSRALLASP